ncbi:MAG: homoserine O-acetyltransferase MetA [Christensenellales bacterium]|jgi:homoserine O-succinyltransferase
MPVKIPNALPAAATLTAENIFVMTETRANTQDIRPLRIAIVNLMPTKEATETQLLRLIGNTPLQVEPVFIRTASYTSTHTSAEYLETFYRTFDEVKHEKFDGCIITGAPVEQMEFEEVAYWDELVQVMDWANENVYSSFYICWGAQAALYHNYGIPKYPLPQKQFGVFRHRVLVNNAPLLRGFDDYFYAPHSRHTEIRREDIEKHPELCIMAESEEAGVFLVATPDGRQVFATGHGEYDADTLEKEYLRDKNLGRPIQPPVNYYPGGDTTKAPVVSWRAHANLLFGNWLNYCVYQETPYDITKIHKR